MKSSLAVAPVAFARRPDPGNFPEQLVLIDVADRQGRVLLQSIWCVDRRGRRVTEVEVVPNEATLLRRLAELVGLLYRLDAGGEAARAIR